MYNQQAINMLGVWNPKLRDKVKDKTVWTNPSSCVSCAVKPLTKASNIQQEFISAKQEDGEKAQVCLPDQGSECIFKGLGKQVWGSVGGASFNWRTLNLPIYGKGLQCLVASKSGPFMTERVPVFKFLWFHWEGGKTFLLGVASGQSSLLCTYFGCMTCGFGLLSLKSRSVSC